MQYIFNKWTNRHLDLWFKERKKLSAFVYHMVHLEECRCMWHHGSLIIILLQCPISIIKSITHQVKLHRGYHKKNYQVPCLISFTGFSTAWVEGLLDFYFFSPHLGNDSMMEPNLLVLFSSPTTFPWFHWAHSYSPWNSRSGFITSPRKERKLLR